MVWELAAQLGGVPIDKRRRMEATHEGMEADVGRLATEVVYYKTWSPRDPMWRWSDLFEVQVLLAR